MPRHEQIQRMRITFGVSEPMCYVSVLDMNRTWERLLNRAHVPVSYTEGFNPHARLYFAAALPLGYKSTCELLDIMLAERMDIDELGSRLAKAAPPGIEIISILEAELHDRSPLKGMREAEYQVTLWGTDRETAQKRVDELLARKNIERERIKKGKKRTYDLRPLIISIDLVKNNHDQVEAHMRLACGPGGSGRPEHIIDELALDPPTRFSIVRKALIWNNPMEEAE